MDKETGMNGLQATARKKTRNPAIEICRLVASVSVIFIHQRFPGILGEVMNCLARFAVPFFFIVSGYFAYRVDTLVIKKRAVSVLKLNIYSTLIYLFWESYQAKYVFGQSISVWQEDVFSQKEIVRWIINCANPLASHLWYLSAIFLCYFILYMYVRWNGKPCQYFSLYMAGLLLYAVHFMMSSLVTAADFSVPYMIYRNVWFFGIPMFCLGIFLKEHQNKIFETYRLSSRMLFMIGVFGAALSVFQWVGTGSVEMPAGTLIEVIALMLLLVSCPVDFGTGKVAAAVISRLGELSTYIYVTHVFWRDVYNIYWQKYVIGIGETGKAYLSPVLVVLISVGTGVVWLILKASAEKVLRLLSDSSGKNAGR